jgi:hypothetical protein
MLRSDDPCAMATTLMRADASAVNTRAATPGLPAMPSPTTATTAIPFRAVTSSINPLASSFRKAFRTLCTARSASASGSVKPIELSDDAWKMVDTDSRSDSIAPNVLAAIPCTPIMPLPETVTIAWRDTMATALTGYPGAPRCAETSVPD